MKWLVFSLQLIFCVTLSSSISWASLSDGSEVQDIDLDSSPSIVFAIVTLNSEHPGLDVALSPVGKKSSEQAVLNELNVLDDALKGTFIPKQPLIRLSCCNPVCGSSCTDPHSSLASR